MLSITHQAFLLQRYLLAYTTPLICKTGAVPEDGCTALTNAAEANNTVVLMRRSGCSFVEKLRNAQAAGAVAAIVADTVAVDKWAVIMSAASHKEARLVRIPGVFVDHTTGQALWGAVKRGEQSQSQRQLLSALPAAVSFLKNWLLPPPPPKKQTWLMWLINGDSSSSSRNGRRSSAPQRPRVSIDYQHHAVLHSDNLPFSADPLHYLLDFEALASWTVEDVRTELHYLKQALRSASWLDVCVYWPLSALRFADEWRGLFAAQDQNSALQATLFCVGLLLIVAGWELRWRKKTGLRQLLHSVSTVPYVAAQHTDSSTTAATAGAADGTAATASNADTDTEPAASISTGVAASDTATATTAGADIDPASSATAATDAAVAADTHHIEQCAADTSASTMQNAIDTSPLQQLHAVNSSSDNSNAADSSSSTGSANTAATTAPAKAKKLEIGQESLLPLPMQPMCAICFEDFEQHEPLMVLPCR
jgi:PA domain